MVEPSEIGEGLEVAAETEALAVAVPAADAAGLPMAALAAEVCLLLPLELLEPLLLSTELEIGAVLAGLAVQQPVQLFEVDLELETVLAVFE